MFLTPTQNVALGEHRIGSGGRIGTGGLAQTAVQDGWTFSKHQTDALHGAGRLISSHVASMTKS